MVSDLAIAAACYSKLEQRVTERTAEINDSNVQLRREVEARKYSEAALSRQAEELKRCNADLEKFASVASHDLQEPLRMIASFADLLKARYRDKLDGNAREFIDFIVEAHCACANWSTTGCRFPGSARAARRSSRQTAEFRVIPSIARC